MRTPVLEEDTDESTEIFYDQLDKAKLPVFDMKKVVGDCNAEVGKENNQGSRNNPDEVINTHREP